MFGASSVHLTMGQDHSCGELKPFSWSASSILNTTNNVVLLKRASLCTIYSNSRATYSARTRRSTSWVGRGSSLGQCFGFETLMRHCRTCIFSAWAGRVFKLRHHAAAMAAVCHYVGILMQLQYTSRKCTAHAQQCFSPTN
jgi:hypothetical protein